MQLIDWNRLNIKVDETRSNIQLLYDHNDKLLEHLMHFSDIECLDSHEYTNIINENYALLEFIVYYHDIGKYYSSVNHAEHSYEMVRNSHILDEYPFSDEDKNIALEVIREHLLLGNVFTGEWSVSYLYKVLKRVKLSGIGESIFLKYLIIISTVDVWAYVDDEEYSKRMFYNYKLIIDYINERSVDFNIVENAKWRLASFCGAYKNVNYLELSKYLNIIDNNIIMTQHAQFKKFVELFQRVNFEYAIWLLCRFSYSTLESYNSHRIEDVNVNSNLKVLLKDIMDLVSEDESDDIWNVTFLDYRGNDKESEKVFVQLGHSMFINNVIRKKKVNRGNKSIEYSFATK